LRLRVVSVLAVQPVVSTTRTFHRFRLRCQEVIGHSLDTRIQYLDAFNDFRQVLDDQSTFDTRVRSKQPCRLVPVPSRNIDKRNIGIDSKHLFDGVPRPPRSSRWTAVQAIHEYLERLHRLRPHHSIVLMIIKLGFAGELKRRIGHRPRQMVAILLEILGRRLKDVEALKGIYRTLVPDLLRRRRVNLRSTPAFTDGKVITLVMGVALYTLSPLCSTKPTATIMRMMRTISFSSAPVTLAISWAERDFEAMRSNKPRSFATWRHMCRPAGIHRQRLGYDH